MTTTDAFLRLDVSGVPVPQGSMKTWMHHGHPIITSASKGLKQWRHLVAMSASDGMRGRAPIAKEDYAVSLVLRFHLPRPATTRKTQRAPRTRPDLDKLARSVFDALTKVAFEDDSQVIALAASKEYANGRAPGVEIEVWAVEDGARRKGR